MNNNTNGYNGYDIVKTLRTKKETKFIFAYKYDTFVVDSNIKYNSGNIYKITEYFVPSYKIAFNNEKDGFYRTDKPKNMIYTYRYETEITPLEEVMLPIEFVKKYKLLVELKEQMNNLEKELKKTDTHINLFKRS